MGENYDQSGGFIDAKERHLGDDGQPHSHVSAPAAAQALDAALATSSTVQAQLVDGQLVPEPATILYWLGSLART